MHVPSRKHAQNARSVMAAALGVPTLVAFTVVSTGGVADAATGDALTESPTVVVNADGSATVTGVDGCPAGDTATIAISLDEDLLVNGSGTINVRCTGTDPAYRAVIRPVAGSYTAGGLIGVYSATMTVHNPDGTVQGTVTRDEIPDYHA
jgi:hypothetical protein